MKESRIEKIHREPAILSSDFNNPNQYWTGYIHQSSRGRRVATK